ncbi:transmembrane protein, putative [Rhizoctonia solani AG-3 Rhs1AP]|uniref:Transmembrane protein, putative n=2 Tax=Rhizoctonia solani AG-3 TaxID=1086053 RepID=X8J9P4_9AGAM|nr:transmembrane protein, putative [Rhizoctonia solani AG-3 Rhs1AP]KEP50866.1 putative transmembrane protein [Rhizoctonia solani 123E]
MADSSRTLVTALIRTEMWTQTTTGCVIVVLAAVLAAMWRRRRWRRAKPWLAKLRAETANKTEKERMSNKETPKETLRTMPKDIPKELSDKEKKIKAESVKRTKERRRRGKDSKPIRTSTVPPSSTDNQLTPPAQPSPSPHLIPLPPSPTMSPTLVFSGPISPVSTAFGTEIPTSTPPTSTPVSPVFSTTAKPRLPAFPPASPLPPTLARKPPPIVRRPIPSIDTNTGSPNRKPSYIAERKGSKEGAGAEEVEFPTLNSFPREERPKAGRKPSDAGRKDRARKPSDAHKKATPESTQIASLKGALEAARLREEEVAEERRTWHKKEQELQTQVNQLSHQLHALTIAFASGGGQGFPPYGYGYGTAVDPAQPTTPVMKSETATEAEYVAPARTPNGPAYPAMYIPYPQFPVFMVPHGPPMPSPTPTMSPPPMSPQAPSYLFSQHPWPMHRGGSPMHHGHPMNSPSGMPMNHGAPGIPSRYSNFYSGSPRRGGSHLPRRQGTGTPSTPSVGSVEDSIPLAGMDNFGGDAGFASRDMSFMPPTKDAFSLFGQDRSFSSPTCFPPPSKDPSIPDTTDDYIPLRDDYIPLPPRPSGTKREREPETDDDDDDDSSSSASDEDSVIFEDGSVSESVNLSFRGSERGKGELEAVRIVGEQDTI